MLKKVIAGGLLGGMALIAWMMLTNGILGVRSRVEMKQLQDERWVYEILKERIDEPGGYSVNPPMESPSGPFPAEEPVFSIHYSGFGHGAAGRIFIVNLAVAFIAPTIAAGLLSLTSDRILSRYSRRVLFFAAIGLLFALFGDLNQYGIGSYSLHHALLFAAQNLIGWTLVGLVVALFVRPGTAQSLQQEGLTFGTG